MRTDDGIVGMLNSSATQWRRRFNLDINLSGGSIILGGILSGSKSYGAETLTVVTAEPDSDNGDPKEQLTRYNRDPSWDEEITGFADSILDNGPDFRVARRPDTAHHAAGLSDLLRRPAVSIQLPDFQS